MISERENSLSICHEFETFWFVRKSVKPASYLHGASQAMKKIEIV